jgi:hypothetical protein
MDQILEQIRKWLNIDVEWWEHLVEKEFECGCKYDDYYEDSNYCRLYQMILSAKAAQKKYEEETRRLEVYEATGKLP